MAYTPSPYCIVDVETTGLHTDGTDHVIEISAMRFTSDHQLDGELTVLLNHGIQIPSNIQELTGITQEEINTHGIRPEKALDELRMFIGNRPVIAYNAPFDVEMLKHECWNYHMPNFINKYACALSAARFLLPGLGSYKLADVAAALGLTGNGYHRAHNDVLVTKEIIVHLLDYARNTGADPDKERYCYRLFDEVMHWRDTLSNRLGVQAWHLLSKEEVAAISQYDRTDKQPDYSKSSKDLIMEILNVPELCQIMPTEQPRNYLIAWNGISEIIHVNIESGYCSKCGYSPYSRDRCKHVRGVIKTLANNIMQQEL
jgi:DNA polymerase III epsilon subunit-like protein